MEKLKQLGRRAGRLSAAQVFVLLCTVFGLFFVFHTPWLWGSDETFHIARIYQLSSGYLRAQDLGNTRETGGYGGETPENIYNLILKVNHDQVDNEETGTAYGTKNVANAAAYEELGRQPLENGKLVQYGFPNTAAYSPVAYLPDIVGMWIARAAGFDIASTVILLRLLNLAFFVGAVYIALRILAAWRFKWIIFVIALLPMTVFEASIITADAITNGAILLLSALVIKLLIERKAQFSKLEVALLFGLTALLPLIKPGYIILAGLLLLIPGKRFPGRWVGSVGKYALLALTAGLFGAWTLATSGIADAAALIRPGPGWENVDPEQQMLFILHHPWTYLVIFARTFLMEGWQYFTEMLGVLGFNRVSIPGIVIVLEILLMALAVGVTEKTRLHLAKPLIMVALVLVSTAMIITGMYITYADVAAPMLRGIQGRYFIPLLPVLLAGIALVAGKRFALAERDNTTYHLIAGSICIIAFVCLVLSALKYQYVTWG